MMIIWKQIHFKERDLAAMTEEEQIAYAMQVFITRSGLLHWTWNGFSWSPKSLIFVVSLGLSRTGFG